MTSSSIRTTRSARSALVVAGVCTALALTGGASAASATTIQADAPTTALQGPLVLHAGGTYIGVQHPVIDRGALVVRGNSALSATTARGAEYRLPAVGTTGEVRDLTTGSCVGARAAAPTPTADIRPAACDGSALTQWTVHADGTLTLAGHDDLFLGITAGSAPALDLTQGTGEGDGWAVALDGLQAVS